MNVSAIKSGIDSASKDEMEDLLLYLIHQHTKANAGIWIGDNYGHREAAVVRYLNSNKIMVATATPGRGNADFLTEAGGWGEIKTMKKARSKKPGIRSGQSLGWFDNISRTENYFSDRFDTVVFAVFENESIHTLITIKPEYRDAFFVGLDIKRERRIAEIEKSIVDSDARKRAMTRGVSISYSDVLEWIGEEGIEVFTPGSA